ncbi:MAG: alkaline phosphatase D family protein [Deltaproteobacteria bacterium]|nr:alkaline phosphatase D family protein [Deltaproteobacteria bacterium]
MTCRKLFFSLWWRTTTVVLFAIGSAGLAHSAQSSAPQVTHGVASGDVTPTSAVVWARASSTGVMQVTVRPEGTSKGKAVRRETAVSVTHDFTGRVLVDGLVPDTAYRYTVAFSGGKAESGTFRTAPARTSPKAVRFAWSGDLGSDVCRDRQDGYPIFQALNREALDFFLALGDMIYADFTCEATGFYGNPQIPGDFPAASELPHYWAHWRYNRDDAGYRQMLARMPYYAIWDDHEVSNDFGPLHVAPGPTKESAEKPLIATGLAAFLDYNPIAEHPDTPKRLYRSVRWGKHLELILLDTRQYRDANFAPDDPKTPKSMLGREQLTWLKETLTQSDATWKVIVSSVPMSVPTGVSPQIPPEEFAAFDKVTGLSKLLPHLNKSGGLDGWANYEQGAGFEQELIEILRFMQRQGVNNNIWLTTDVHFAAAFRYTPFADAPKFHPREFISGPLSALLFPNPLFDTTLGTERLFFYGAEKFTDIRSYEAAKPWFNYGAVEIDADGNLTVQIHKVDGTVVYQETLQPQR